jgi:hypothetical protein
MRAVDSWRNLTPGERRERNLRIRWNRKEADDARSQWEAKHGGVGLPGSKAGESERAQNVAEAHSAASRASWESGSVNASGSVFSAE